MTDATTSPLAGQIANGFTGQPIASLNGSLTGVSSAGLSSRPIIGVLGQSATAITGSLSANPGGYVSGVVGAGLATTPLIASLLLGGAAVGVSGSVGIIFSGGATLLGTIASGSASKGIATPSPLFFGLVASGLSGTIPSTTGLRFISGSLGVCAIGLFISGFSRVSVLTGRVATGTAGIGVPIYNGLILGAGSTGLAGPFIIRFLTLANNLLGVVGNAFANAVATAIVTSIFNYEGFDHENAQFDLLEGIVWSFVNCTGSISTNTPYNVGGSLDVQVSGTASATEGFAVYNSGAQTISGAVLGVMLQSSIVANVTTEVGFLAGTIAQVYCKIIGSTISIYRGPQATPTLLETLFNVIPAYGWFYLELQATISSSNGNLVVYVNGTQIANYTGLNTSATGTSLFNGIMLGGISPANVTSSFLFDDIYIGQSNLGPLRVTTLYPIGSGSQVQFLSSGTVPNWQAVASPAMDGDASYNYTSTPNLEDQFTTADLVSTVNNIVALKVSIAARRDASSALAMRTLVASGNGTTSYGLNTALSNSYQYISDIYLGDPVTGNWSLSSINAAQIGYGILDAAYVTKHTAASLDFNFTTMTTFDPGITFARASTGTYYDATGTLQSAAANLARIDYGYNPGGTTNWIRNNTSIGAVVGLPGTLPSFWSQSTTAGITASVFAIGSETGIPYIDVQFSGTASVGVTDIFLEAITGVPALSGQAWTDSVYCKLVSGTLTNISSIVFKQNENTSSGALVTSGTFGSITPTVATLASQRFSSSRTLTGGSSVQYVEPGIEISFANGPVNAVVRIGGVQMEQAIAVGTPLSTSGTSITTGVTAIGMLIEETRTNSIRNPRFEGAVVGTPGTYPTNWSQSNTTGIVPAVIAVGKEYGIPYIDLQYVGTATTGTNLISFESTVAASPSNWWSNSVYVRIVGGTTSNISAIGILTKDNLANSYTTLISPTINALGSQRFTSTFLTNSGAVTGLTFIGMEVIPTAAGAINLTLRIGAPQLELGQFATSVNLPIVGIPATTTRAEETAYMTTFGSVYQANAAGTIASETLWNSVPIGGTHDIWDATDGMNNSLQLFNQLTQQYCYVTTETNGVTGINGGLGTKTITNGTVLKHAVTWTPTGSFTDAASATGGSTVTASLPQNITLLSMGNAYGGGSPLDAYVRRFRYWPRVMQTPELINTTT